MNESLTLLRETVSPFVMALFVVALLVHVVTQAYSLWLGLGELRRRDRFSGLALATAAGIQLFAALCGIPLTYLLLQTFADRFGAASLVAVLFGALLPVAGGLLFAGAGVSFLFAQSLSRALATPQQRAVKPHNIRMNDEEE